MDNQLLTEISEKTFLEYLKECERWGAHQEESQEERQMNLKGEADEPERKLMVAMMLVRVKIRFIVEYKGKTPSAVRLIRSTKTKTNHEHDTRNMNTNLIPRIRRI